MAVAWRILSMRKAAGPPRISACLERTETAGLLEKRRDRVRVPWFDVGGSDREKIEAEILAAAKEKWLAIQAAELEGAAAVDGTRLKTALDAWEVSRA